MQDEVLQFFKDRFEKYGYNSSATFSEICFHTKIKSDELRPILDKLLEENKIIFRSSEDVDLYSLRMVFE